MTTLIAPRSTTRFVHTTASRQIKDAIAAAIDLGYPTLITGEPGTGKTTALLYHTAQFTGVYCQVGYASRTVKGMYQMLLDAHGIAVDRAFLKELSELVYWQLKPAFEAERGRLLIVDEVQTLDLSALRELLNIQETCRIPLVLSGNIERLARTKSHDSALEQINSRIGMRVRLGKPFPEDCRDLAIEFNVEGKDAYAAVEAYGARTSIRDLVKLLEVAERITGGVGSIKLGTLEHALLTLNGDQDALSLIVTEEEDA